MKELVSVFEASQKTYISYWITF